MNRRDGVSTVHLDVCVSGVPPISKQIGHLSRCKSDMSWSENPAGQVVGMPLPPSGGQGRFAAIAFVVF